MICLSFDTDHMNADGMRRFLDTVELPGRGTFFLWQPFPNFDWGVHEAAPHPHFEDVRDPVGHFTDYFAELDMAVGSDMAPVGLRTHSCVTSHMISLAAAQVGCRYTSMTTRLGESGIKPYREPWGVWEMPIYYMDNMDFCTATNWPGSGHTPFDETLLDRAVQDDALYIFDFHPLHIALNSPDFEHYQSVKEHVAMGRGNPFDHAHPGYGTRTFYETLLTKMKAQGLESERLDILTPPKV